jgi:hypothetical protein
MSSLTSTNGVSTGDSDCRSSGQMEVVQFSDPHVCNVGVNHYPVSSEVVSKLFIKGSL